MADRTTPWRELTGDDYLDSLPEDEMQAEILRRRQRRIDIAVLDAEIAADQDFDRARKC
jgi:hypothetical protein